MAIGPAVHPSKESGPYVFGLLDPRYLSDHRSDEDHGLLAVPALPPGASQLLSEDCHKAPARLALWRIIEPWCEVANYAAPSFP